MGISTFTFKYWKLCDSKLIIENMRNEISANQSGDITTSLVRKWQLSIGKWNARFAFYSFPDSFHRIFLLCIAFSCPVLLPPPLSLSLSLLSYSLYSMSVSIFQIITTRRQYIFILFTLFTCFLSCNGNRQNISNYHHPFFPNASLYR